MSSAMYQTSGDRSH